MGVFSNYSGSSDFYIADSVFLGRNDPKHLTGWNGPFWQQFENVDGQEYPPVMKSYTGDPALRPRPRRRPQLRRRLPRRHRHRDVRHAGWIASDRRAELSAARVLGPPADRDRHLQQLHHQRARQLDRDGRQHAQHPRDAEHADQLGVASDEHAAVHRRADLLHPQHRLSRAGRIDAADGRIARRVLLQQHDPDRDQRRRVGQRALAQQPDARTERAGGDLQRQHQHQLQLVGLQRLPSESRQRVVSVELAAVDVADDSRRRHQRARSSRRASSRRWRPTRRRRSRISTACSSTTTSS